jgi:hypothetical protein
MTLIDFIPIIVGLIELIVNTISMIVALLTFLDKRNKQKK